MRPRSPRSLALAFALVASACSGGSKGDVGPTGPAGPQGPQGPTGPAGTVVFGTTAGTAAEGNDPRLSDARSPLPGSVSYIQNGVVSQVASLNITGSGTFGGALTASQLTTSGGITASAFTGSGAGLTSLPAASLTGTVPDSTLSANVPRLSANNTFSGTNTFSGQLTIGLAPSSATDAASKGYVDTATAALARSARYFAEQTGAALQVLGTTWTAVPGAQVAFTSVASSGYLLASGTVLGVGSGTVGTCGFRFVVDGVGLGDASWGDRLIQCGTSTAVPATAMYCSWTMQRVVSLAAGSHTIGIEQVGMSATSGCQGGGGSYSNAKLMVSTY